MRKQNRNNRICTNEESGKTDFIIDPLLPIGKENAITTQELMRISGCGSSRELRQRIALERERGAIICSGSGRGYWKPKNRQEIQEFIKTMDARAWNTLKGASEAYQYFEDKIKEAGGNVVDGILLGILDALLGIGSWIVDNVFKPILDGFKNAFGIHSPSTVMQEQGHYIIEGLLLGITDFLSKIKKKFEEIRNLVTEKMDNIKSSAVSKVNEMKKGLSDGVERIKESFRSGFSTLVGYVKSPINSIIRFINNFLYAIQTMQNSFANALNSMSISLPHWLEKLTGFSSVGFNVGYWSAPMVPYLAQGAVIPPNKEFMAVLGDQKSGNNIEAPESLIRRIVREESGNGKGSTYNVTAQVNRRTLFDLVLEEGKVRRTVTGRNPFETV